MGVPRGPNLADASQPIALRKFCRKSKVWALELSLGEINQRLEAERKAALLFLAARFASLKFPAFSIVPTSIK